MLRIEVRILSVALPFTCSSSDPRLNSPFFLTSKQALDLSTDSISFVSVCNQMYISVTADIYLVSV